MLQRFVQLSVISILIAGLFCALYKIREASYVWFQDSLKTVEETMEEIVEKNGYSIESVENSDNATVPVTHYYASKEDTDSTVEPVVEPAKAPTQNIEVTEGTVITADIIETLNINNYAAEPVTEPATVIPIETFDPYANIAKYSMYAVAVIVFGAVAIVALVLKYKKPEDV